MIHATKNKTATIGKNVCFNNLISGEILETKQNQKKERKKVKKRNKGYRATRRKLFKARKLQAKYFIHGKRKYSGNCMYNVLTSSLMSVSLTEIPVTSNFGTMLILISLQLYFTAMLIKVILHNRRSNHSTHCKCCIKSDNC